MALDSRERRASAAGAVLPFMLGVTANVAKDAQWRAQSGWSYSGLIADAGGGGRILRAKPMMVVLGKMMNA